MNEIENKDLHRIYEIVLQGILDERWMGWFDGMLQAELPGGRTLLRGEVIDQAALHGLLSRIRDLGMPLLLLRRGDVEVNLKNFVLSDVSKNEEN